MATTRATMESRLGPLTDDEADALRFARRAWLRTGTEAGWGLGERMTLVWIRCFETIRAPDEPAATDERGGT